MTTVNRSEFTSGWTDGEVEVLKIALKKYGIGKWNLIKKVNCLPGKSIVQMNLKTQKLIGQQSLSAFKGIHARIEDILKDNKKRKDVIRKNNCIINTGDNLTKQKRKELLLENRNKYGIPKDEYKKLKLPKLISKSIGDYLSIKQILDEKNNLTLIEKIEELKNLKKCMCKKLEILNSIKVKKQKMFLCINKDDSNSTENFADLNIICKKFKCDDGSIMYKLYNEE